MSHNFCFSLVVIGLFGPSKTNISECIKYIFEEGGFQRDSVVRKIRTTAKDGENYNIGNYK